MITYPVHYRYTKDHVWVELDGDHGKVGVTDHGVSQVGDVVYVDLPPMGASLKQGQSFGTIESPEGFLELQSPMPGEVVMVNTALMKNPETANADPHRCWFIVLKLGETVESETLLDASQYADLIKTRLTGLLGD